MSAQLIHVTEAVVDTVAAAVGTNDWSLVLERIDRDEVRLNGGQSTAVVISVTAAGIEGASVGDSGAWVIRGTQIEDLTAGQQREPLVGAGCVPVPFRDFRRARCRTMSRSSCAGSRSGRW